VEEYKENLMKNNIKKEWKLK